MDTSYVWNSIYLHGSEMKRKKTEVERIEVTSSNNESIRIYECAIRKFVTYSLFGGLFYFMTCLSSANAQEAKTLNLPKYDRASFQFGFMLGTNTADIIIDKVVDFHYIDTAYVVQAESQSGLNLGIVATKQFGPYFD